ncbi:hypothetical protein [Flavobacterium sp. U410]
MLLLKTNNLELEQMIRIDQKIRIKKTDKYLEAVDQTHWLRIFEILANNELKASKDNVV